jgi:Phosphotransferase enzyme family
MTGQSVLAAPQLRPSAIDVLTASVALGIRRSGGPVGAAHLVRLRRKPHGMISAGYSIGTHRVWVTLSPGFGPPATWIAEDVIGRWPGVLLLPAAGMRIEPFPHDAALPGLAALVSDPSLVLPGAEAKVVRHKPGARCVLRLWTATEACYVKLHGDAEQAATAWEAARRLADDEGMRAHLPRPERFVPELGAVVTEEVEGVPGGAVYRPGRSRAGRALLDARVPVDELKSAGAALARLHAVPAAFVPESATGTALVVKTAARGAEIAGLSPGLARRVHDVTEATIDALGSGCGGPRLGHGAYKPSQVLLTRHGVVVTDFDSLDRADPARDLGYFLGYLRPGVLLRDVDGARRWFDGAAAAFTVGYAEEAVAGGRAAGEVAGALSRTGPHEAAALLKRTARRAHRVNAARDSEVDAVLREVEHLLAGSAGDPR